MAGRVAYQFELTGLDISLTKLREIHKLLQDISKITGGKMGFGGVSGVPGGMPGAGYPIYPVIPPHPTSGGSSALGTAVGVAVGSNSKNVNSSLKIPIDNNAPRKSSPLTAAEKIEFDKRTAEYRAGQSFFGGGLGSFSLIRKGKGFPNLGNALKDLTQTLNASGIETPQGTMPFKETQLTFGAIKEFARSQGGPGQQTPPVIPPSNLPPWFQRGSGGLQGKFPGFLTGITNASAGLTSLFLPLTGAILAATAALGIFKRVIEVINHGIQNGAQAFQGAARIGHGVAVTSQLKSALAMLGMSGEETAILQAQFNPRARTSIVAGQEDIMLGAARASQMGNIQQLNNMSEEFKSAMKDSASSAKQMEIAAGAMQNLFALINANTRELQTFLTQLVTTLYAFIKPILVIFEYALKLANLYLELKNRISRFFGLIPGQRDFTQIGGSMRGGIGNETAWEKIGFTFPGNASERILEKIEQHTGIMARIMQGAKTTAQVGPTIARGVFDAWSAGYLMP